MRDIDRLKAADKAAVMLRLHTKHTEDYDYSRFIILLDTFAHSHTRRLHVSGSEGLAFTVETKTGSDIFLLGGKS